MIFVKVSDKVKKFFDTDSKAFISYLQTSDIVDLSNHNREWEDVKGYINKNVKSIKINYFSCKKDLEFFRSFHNLEKLEIDGEYVLSQVELDILCDLGIKEISVCDLSTSYFDTGKNFIGYEYNGVTSLVYNGVRVNVRSKNKIVNPNLLSFNSLPIDVDSIIRIIENYDIQAINGISINSGFPLSNSYLIKMSENKIIDFQIKSNNIREIQSLFNFFVNNGYVIENVNISYESHDSESLMSEINKFLSLFNSDKIINKKISYVSGSQEFSISLHNNVIQELKLKTLDLSLNESVLNRLVSSGYVIEKVIFDITEFNKYSDEFNISLLRDISNKFNLDVTYNILFTCGFEEFYALYESVRWYRKLINSYELSPVEKVMYGYDLMKTIPYNNNGKSGYDNRAPHFVISTSYIVCAGYANLFHEIFDRFDDNIGSLMMPIKDMKHARILSRIDDNKYNIHGIYELDPTFDMNIPEQFHDKLGIKDYGNSFDLYKYFLVPMKQHIRVFNSVKIPYYYLDVIQIMKDMENGKFKEENYSNMEWFTKQLFGEKVSFKKIVKYAMCDRPSLSDFMKMLFQVRVAEGFSEEEATKEVQSVVLFNQEYIKCDNNSREQKEFLGVFFEDKVDRKK